MLYEVITSDGLKRIAGYTSGVRTFPDWQSAADAIRNSQQSAFPDFTDAEWMSYGLGSENANLPAFVVLISHGSAARTAQPLFSRLWSSGFLPSDVITSYSIHYTKLYDLSILEALRVGGAA